MRNLPPPSLGYFWWLLLCLWVRVFVSTHWINVQLCKINSCKF
jgi:hypothetical protein